MHTSDGAGIGAGHVTSPGPGPGLVQVPGVAAGSALPVSAAAGTMRKRFSTRNRIVELKLPKMRNTADFGSAGENFSALEAFQGPEMDKGYHRTLRLWLFRLTGEGLTGRDGGPRVGPFWRTTSTDAAKMSSQPAPRESR